MGRPSYYLYGIIPVRLERNLKGYQQAYAFNLDRQVFENNPGILLELQHDHSSAVVQVTEAEFNRQVDLLKTQSHAN